MEETPTRPTAVCLNTVSVVPQIESLLATFSTELGLSHIDDTEYHRADWNSILGGKRNLCLGETEGGGHLCVCSFINTAAPPMAESAQKVTTNTTPINEN